MNIAVVGGGKRCQQLIEMIGRQIFQQVDPRILVVAEPDPEAPGVVAARKRGILVVDDYNRILERDDLDLIVELTGSMDVYNDIIARKKNDVRAIASQTAQLFWEIARVSTLQKKTDQELQETRSLYYMVINELLQEDVLVIAYDHRILDANDNLLGRLGLTREQVIGRPCYEITHKRSAPCDGDRHPCPLIETLETEKPSQTTHVHLDKENREIYYSISTYPLIENGDVIGAIEISRDISKDINIQKTLMQQEKMASIGRLSAGVAHEINNPLTTILTTTMLVQEDLDNDDPIYQELETIAQETLRCRKIVTSLLDFARQNKPVKKPHKINEIVLDSIILTNKQAAFKDIGIEHDLEQGPDQVAVDKGQLEQVLINLILNAIDATDPGGCIAVKTRRDEKGRRFLIQVIDNGHGIAAGNLDKIFEPFFTTKENGTGLGLALVHGIIQEHGGTIKVDSTPGQGTTFTIVLRQDEVEDHGL